VVLHEMHVAKKLGIVRGKNTKGTEKPPIFSAPSGFICRTRFHPGSAKSSLLAAPFPLGMHHGIGGALAE
jgi:hypothetical protein